MALILCPHSQSDVCTEVVVPCIAGLGKDALQNNTKWIIYSEFTILTLTA